MTPVTPGGSARERLGAALYQRRQLAGLSGRALAEPVGVSQASISRAESGQQLLTMGQVEAWADATNTSTEERELLIALATAAQSSLDSHRERLTSARGVAGMQVDVEALEQKATSVRIFQPTLIPGLLQTAEYARQIIAAYDVSGQADVPAGVAARLRRQEILFRPEQRFVFLLTETPLRRLRLRPELVAVQLARLETIGSLTNVEFGVIPESTPVLFAEPPSGFNLYENRSDGSGSVVTMETSHAWVTSGDPDTVAIYQDTMDRLGEAAVFGAEARAEIRRIVQDS